MCVNEWVSRRQPVLEQTCYTSTLFPGDEWVSQHHDDRITSQEHLWDVAIFVHWLWFFLSFAALGHLCPHFFHILQNHITMPENTRENRQQFYMHPCRWLTPTKKMSGADLKQCNQQEIRVWKMCSTIMFMFSYWPYSSSTSARYH